MFHNGSLSVLAQPPACPAGDEASHRNISEPKEGLEVHPEAHAQSGLQNPAEGLKIYFPHCSQYFLAFFFFFFKQKMLRVDESILHNF